ncbi:baseplate J/gp47 family protein [Neoroseomonas lacus]|uniref:Tail protein n=1 Tax=Neoroseomonas lacus TaxID=287609 RepID=A0A917KLG8_9PROT|nr:baseplate J/gp47 family protein [Neoroseomonas lacus]GGJ14291.1 tail protein [Neoroseomonas lacus]
MSFERPTLSALRVQARADMAARLTGTDAALRRALAMVLAEAFAALAHHQYGYLDHIARQVIPDTAEGVYLDRWCRIVGLARKPATAAGGLVTATGTNGTDIAAGVTLTRSDGVVYAVAALATIASGTAELSVLAATPGADGGLEAGASLTFVTAIPGVTGTATVGLAGLTGGGPEESDTALRDRLRARLSAPPTGGSATDYVAWALEITGVTRAWCLPLNRGPGTVDVAFVMDDREDIFPEPGDVAIVQAHIDAVRPVTANCVVFSPTPAPINVTITGLNPDSAAVRAAIATELAAQIRRDAAPAGIIHRSRLIEAIARAAGESWHTMTVPSADVTQSAGALATLGTVTFA